MRQSLCGNTTGNVPVVDRPDIGIFCGTPGECGGMAGLGAVTVAFVGNMRLAHRTAHGGLLIDWLVGVPSDPFSNRPLVYRSQTDGHLLYSVGANGIDDGGVAAEWSDMLQGHGDLFLDDPATKADNSDASDGRSPAGT